MRQSPAVFRMLAPLIAAGVLRVGCGPSPAAPHAPAAPALSINRPGPADGSHSRRSEGARCPRRPGLPAGGLVYKNPANNRNELVLADVAHRGTHWRFPVNAEGLLAAAGHRSPGLQCKWGMGGTGYVASNGKTGNYIDALQRGDWVLPFGDPPLIVIQGGGNDATQRATDAQISSNAERLLAALKKRYPGTTLAMIGTLARGVSNGGGRRTEIDALLGRIAAKHAIPFVSAGDWLTRYNAIGDLQDGVHLKPAGHAKLGAALAREFTALGLTARPDSSEPAK